MSRTLPCPCEPGRRCRSSLADLDLLEPVEHHVEVPQRAHRVEQLVEPVADPFAHAGIRGEGRGTTRLRPTPRPPPSARSRTPRRATSPRPRARAARSARTPARRRPARFSRIRSGYTSSPSSTSVISASMKCSAIVESGRITRSADECEMSRSCQSTVFSSAACRLPRITRASPVIAFARGRGSACGASRSNPSVPR